MANATEETLLKLLRGGASSDAAAYKQSDKGTATPANKFTLSQVAAFLATFEAFFLGTGTEYVQVHDSTGSVSSATQLGPGYPVSADLPILLREFETWRYCASGIVIALSSTRDTYTASAQTMRVFGQWVPA